MFGSDQQLKEKLKHQVDIHLRDGTEIQANIFLSRQQRLVDMLNDTRMFMPVENNDGAVIMLNKSSIAHVIPTDQSIERTEPVPMHIGVG